MPFCRKCGAEYHEGDIFCERCGADLRRSTTEKRVAEEAQKPTDKAVQDAIKYLEEKRIEEAQKSTKEEKKTGRIAGRLILGLIILGVLGVGSYEYIQMQQQKNIQIQQEKNIALENQVAQYQNVVRDDKEKLISIVQTSLGNTRAALFAGDLSSMSYSASTKYVEDYSNQANLNKQHLMEFKDFVTSNENALQAIGVDTIQLKSSIDNDLSNIEKNLREMQANLQKLKEQEAVRESINRFNQYISVINNDFTNLNALSKKYPTKMTDDIYVQYVRDYSTIATVYKQHLSEFRSFIVSNEPYLQTSGINTIERKADIDRKLSFIDQTAKEMEKNLQQIAERQKQAAESQKQTLELLKMLIPLIL